jgi:hypothetical protein
LQVYDPRRQIFQFFPDQGVEAHGFLPAEHIPSGGTVSQRNGVFHGRSLTFFSLWNISDEIIIAQTYPTFYGNIGYFWNYIDLFQSSWYTGRQKEAVVCTVS